MTTELTLSIVATISSFGALAWTIVKESFDNKEKIKVSAYPAVCQQMGNSQSKIEGIGMSALNTGKNDSYITGIHCQFVGEDKFAMIYLDGIISPMVKNISYPYKIQPRVAFSQGIPYSVLPKDKKLLWFGVLTSTGKYFKISKKELKEINKVL